MKGEDKSFVTTTQVVAEIHHYHYNESTNLKADLDNLEDQFIRKFKEITLTADNNHINSKHNINKDKDDPDLSPDLIVESSEILEDRSFGDEDGWSSSVDEIEEDCSDLTSYRTDSYSSGESSDARGPSPCTLSPSARRRSVSLSEGYSGSLAASAYKKCTTHHGIGLTMSATPGMTATTAAIATAAATSTSNYVRYDKPSQVPYTNRYPKTAGMNFNTNLRKPPENWLRMRSAAQGSGHNVTGSGWGRHGAPYWSYPYSKTSSWSMFAFRYAGRGRRAFHKGLANNIVCLCCGCCNCSRVNQTCCCCCYHCVHRISSCRRPDMTKFKATASTSGPHKSVSNSLQPGAGTSTSEGETSGAAAAAGTSGVNGRCHLGEVESGLESGMDSGTESTSGKASERSKKESSSGEGSGKSSTTLPTPSNETMPKSHKLSTLF